MSPVSDSIDQDPGSPFALDARAGDRGGLAGDRASGFAGDPVAPGGASFDARAIPRRSLSVSSAPPRAGLRGGAIFFGPFPTGLFAGLAAALLGAGSGVYRPARETILHAAAPSGLRAAVISVEQSVKRIGQSLGPLALGVVFGLAGAPAAFYAAVAVVALATALALWRVRPAASVIER